MSFSDPFRVTEIITDVAETEIVPRFRNLSDADIRMKTGPSDLVTVVDEASEIALSRRLRDLLPGSLVVGEEGASKDPRLLDLIAGDTFTWVIDPLDGTFNFAKGVDRFATIVALTRAGRTLAGWIHDPIAQETAVVVDGEGAFNSDRRLRVAEPAPLGAMTGVFSRPRADATDRRAAADRLSASLAQHIKLGCIGLDYMRLADGRAHVAISGLMGKLMPWDHAAGVLMHREAGGHAALIDGAPYAPTLSCGVLVAAPDGASWMAVRKTVGDVGTWSRRQ